MQWTTWLSILAIIVPSTMAYPTRLQHDKVLIARAPADPPPPSGPNSNPMSRPNANWKRPPDQVYEDYLRCLQSWVDQEVPNGHLVKDGELLCYQLHPTEHRIPEIRSAEDERQARGYIKKLQPDKMRIRKYPRPIVPWRARGWDSNKFSDDGNDGVRKLRPSPSILDRIGAAINKMKLRSQPGPGMPLAPVTAPRFAVPI
ncbi:MAG: hypothetical protein M1816_002363 [Peltula sp. TS41687]|nr:MAG: hypothetical protein M1816_002363 [Peltula sp. TS41687]